MTGNDLESTGRVECRQEAVNILKRIYIYTVFSKYLYTVQSSKALPNIFPIIEINRLLWSLINGTKDV